MAGIGMVSVFVEDDLGPKHNCGAARLYQGIDQAG